MHSLTNLLSFKSEKNIFLYSMAMSKHCISLIHGLNIAYYCSCNSSLLQKCWAEFSSVNFIAITTKVVETYLGELKALQERQDNAQHRIIMIMIRIETF